MFSAIERSGASVVSCVTVAMPWRSASVGSRKLVGRPANVNRAAVGLHLAREDLQQRRLARPVLAEQRVHLARVDGQAGAAQGVHATVTLVDALGVEDRIRTRAHRVRQAWARPPGSREGSRVGASHYLIALISASQLGIELTFAFVTMRGGRMTSLTLPIVLVASA